MKTIPGYSADEACQMSVWIHFLAVDFAARKKNEITMNAMDLIDCLTDAFKEI
ncbi:MAG: hypothetical protein FJZ67_11955 [Bacteroidetes bacterium]|nr:hypothetical protein [Bacteroidota bacterium]